VVDTGLANGGRGLEGGTCPPKFGKLLCKIRAFFGQKNHIKFGNFVNFSGKYHKNSGRPILIIFRARIM